MAEVLPHNMLLACWGDFDSNSQKFNFNYDVSSNLANIRTQALFDSPEKLMRLCASYTRLGRLIIADG